MVSQKPLYTDYTEKTDLRGIKAFSARPDRRPGCKSVNPRHPCTGFRLKYQEPYFQLLSTLTAFQAFDNIYLLTGK
jgi:hypothetical protein